MAQSSKQWRRGRGKLGPLQPLLGSWVARADTPMGPVECRRTFARVLGEKYVRLDAAWHFAKGVYQEVAYFRAGDDGALEFWSFTSDGKRSDGRAADASDVHASALAFEAHMPAGLARQVYWPAEDGGFHWAVESRSKKGWNRFVQHHYRPAST